MKRIALFFLFATAAFAETLVLENRTSHPNTDENSRMAVQWASSASEVQTHNQASIQAMKLNPATLQDLNRQGKLKLSIPQHAEYFRVVVWIKGEGHPEFMTNWVEIVPNKTYQLKGDHLITAVLVVGMGC